MKGIVVVMVGAAILGTSACSSGGADRSSASVGSAADRSYASGADLAKAAGCSGYAKQDAQMYTQESGSCQIDGQDVYIATFADQTARDNYMKVAKAAGASGYFGEGAKWVLQSDDKAALEKGTKAAGGELP